MEYRFLIELDGEVIEVDSLPNEQKTALFQKLNVIARESIGFTQNECPSDGKVLE